MKSDSLDSTKIVIKRFFTENLLSCKEVSKDMSAFYDGELDLNRYCSIEKHIKSCAKCRLEYNNLMKTSMMIKSAYLGQENFLDK